MMERPAVASLGGKIVGGLGGHPAPGVGRPEADRADAAVQPGHLHGPVRPRPQALRRDQGRARPPLRRRAVLVQRRQGPLRELPGRGLRHGRAALPAQRLRPLPGLPRGPLQREDAGDQLSGEEHRRRPGDDRRRGRDFFADEPPVLRSLDVLHEVGLGYLRLGQPATELSGGEAQRIKLATELQRAQRGDYALRPRRADHRPAPGRRREADARSSTAWSSRATR